MLTLAPAGLAHAQKTEVIFTAEPTGGSWTTLAAAVSQVINTRAPDLNVQVEPGAGPGEHREDSQRQGRSRLVDDDHHGRYAYIMQAALLVPAIIKLGVTPMAAHMFAFYFSCLSAVTPPVALAVYAAASIGGANLWAAGLQAVKFAAAGFIVPYFFIFNPPLLFSGSWDEILRAVVSGSIGVVALAAGLEGYFLRTALWFERILFLAAALLLIDPGVLTDVIGVGVLAVALLSQKLRTVERASPAQ